MIELAAAVSAAPSAAAAAGAGAPRPFGATPSPQQLRWHAMEASAFVHFTVNTFTDKEWGYGDESPSVFNPTDFDADQIVGAAKSARLRGVILTAKHHDGFCLWPSRFTEHSVKNSPWRGGHGDVVREMADACRRAGLKFGVYLSPWDRSRADYGQPSYVDYYRNQLRELLTGYGPLFEVWFDMANGGDGYYGGARETRKIDGKTYYGWPTTRGIVHELQPEAVVFGLEGADVRWVGNEEGRAGDPCWATVDPGPYTEAMGQNGVRGGPIWEPAEADVSIRPGWFWHASQDSQVKSPARLMEIYYESVGRGANLLLNLPPDRRGRIADPDLESLRAWGQGLRTMFARSLAQGARAVASNSRGGLRAYRPANVVDGRSDTYWSCDDKVITPTLELDLGGPTTFDVVRLREYLPLGLRVDDFAVDAWGDGGWRELAAHRGIGPQRLIKLKAPVATDKVRLRVLSGAACPAITEVALFRQPALPGAAST
jgi:alpha-L-fucosidase